MHDDLCCMVFLLLVIDVRVAWCCVLHGVVLHGVGWCCVMCCVVLCVTQCCVLHGVVCCVVLSVAWC